MSDYEYSDDAKKAIEWCRRVIIGSAAQGKTVMQMVETIDYHWEDAVHRLDEFKLVAKLESQ